MFDFIVTYRLLPDTSKREFYVSAISMAAAIRKALDILNTRFSDFDTEIIYVREDK